MIYVSFYVGQKNQHRSNTYLYFYTKNNSYIVIKIFDSKKSGPNLVIMAGVHGDERCGLNAFTTIIPTFIPLCGKVTFIIGNPRAVILRKRKYEADLNRMFRPAKDLTSSEKNTYEFVRSRELIPILEKADALLDIHSSTTEITTPFVICEKQSFKVSTKLPVETIVSGIDSLHPTGTDAFVNQSGGLGICIECGNHNDPQSTQVAIDATKRFLHYFSVINLKDDYIIKNQRFIKAEFIYKNKDYFRLSKAFKEFEKIDANSTIGIDGVLDVKAPYNGVILFPQNQTKTNSEAFLYGREIIIDSPIRKDSK